MSRVALQDNTLFRPAPFPIYGEDTPRRRLEWLLRLAPWLCLLLVLMPRVAGPSSELMVPVSYARVELAERVPVVLELDLPAGGFTAQPSSLGYFLPGGEFVYSATVIRGLLYGQRDGVVQVIEITAPPAADAYISNQLAAIRQRVAAMNTQANILRLARGAPSFGQQQLADAARRLFERSGSRLEEPPVAVVAAVLEDNGSDLTLLADALRYEAGHRARLKQLYYEGQAARLRLMLSEFDLQIALARLPQAGYAGLLSLGDESLVRDTMLGEIARLRDAWEQRQAELDAVVERDRHKLGTPAFVAIAGVADPFSAAAAPSSYLLLPQLTPPGTVLDPGRQLAATLAQSRLTVAKTEIAVIATGLVELERARRHVQSGKLPGWTDLPHLFPDPTRLRLRGLEALSAFAVVEETARQPDAAVELLLSLALGFEAGDTAAAELHPHEIAYGVLAVDRCLAGLPPGDGGTPALKQTAAQLQARLDAILAFPDDYDAAACSLGLLHFFRWYAGLCVAQPEPPGDTPDAAVDAITPTATEEEPPHAANVDALFN